MKSSYKLLLTLFIYIAIIVTFGSENSELFTMFLSLSLMIPIIYLINDRFKQKNEINRLHGETLKAELNLLKSQINPHFFFNTLNNLYGLAVEKSDQTQHAIYKLSEMMRFTIYDGRKDSVSIRDEINYLNNFIELNKLRYKHSISVRPEYSIENDKQRIPPLLFINLLENAFKHGAENLTEGAYINFILSTTSKKIEFSLENNYEYAEKKKRVGIGVENLKRRLELLYPKKHTFEIEQTDTYYKTNVMIDLT